LTTPADALTDREYWDNYWQNVQLPAEAARRPGDTHWNSILDTFDDTLPRNPALSVAEIGGSPGQYLAYLHRTFGFRITSIDYSHVGCEVTAENFRLLGIPGHVIEADILEPVLTEPRFDLVYSLGLIEHFEDPAEIVAAHVRLVRPGGLLALGVPNFRGIHGWFLRRLRPRTYASHETATMDLARWQEFEHRHGLRIVFKDYIGGFEPRIFRSRRERPRTAVLPVLAVAVVLDWIFHGPLALLRRFNGPLISGYAMAVYAVPDQQVPAPH
jgi:SAM-dependent methyltransferase